MNEDVVAAPEGSGGAKHSRRFTAVDKLKAVRSHLEEGFSLALVSEELNVSKSSLALWLQAYRLGGEAIRCHAMPSAIKDSRPEVCRAF